MNETRCAAAKFLTGEAWKFARRSYRFHLNPDAETPDFAMKKGNIVVDGVHLIQKRDSPDPYIFLLAGLLETQQLHQTTDEGIISNT